MSRSWIFDHCLKAISPNSGKAFTLGEKFEGHYFRCYRKLNGYGVPSFFSSIEAYEKFRLKLKRHSDNKNLIGLIANNLLHDCKKRAKKNGSIVTIKNSDIIKVLSKGLCQGSDPPLKFIFDKPGSPFSPSLDRIDSNNKNYTLENVRVVCRGINTARSNYSDEECLKLMKALIGFIEKKS